MWRELIPGYAAPASFDYREETNPGAPSATLHMRVANDLSLEELETMTPDEIVDEVTRRRAARPPLRIVSNAGAPRGGRVDPREYEVAANAYNRAKAAGDHKPMVAVMNALGLDVTQRQTAWRRVQEAKARGLVRD